MLWRSLFFLLTTSGILCASFPEDAHDPYAPDRPSPMVVVQDDQEIVTSLPYSFGSAEAFKALAESENLVPQPCEMFVCQPPAGDNGGNPCVCSPCVSGDGPDCQSCEACTTPPGEIVLLPDPVSVSLDNKASIITWMRGQNGKGYPLQINAIPNVVRDDDTLLLPSVNVAISNNLVTADDDDPRFHIHWRNPGALGVADDDDFYYEPRTLTFGGSVFSSKPITTIDPAVGSTFDYVLQDGETGQISKVTVNIVNHDPVAQPQRYPHHFINRASWTAQDDDSTFVVIQDDDFDYLDTPLLIQPDALSGGLSINAEVSSNDSGGTEDLLPTLSSDLEQGGGGGIGVLSVPVTSGPTGSPGNKGPLTPGANHIIAAVSVNDGQALVFDRATFLVVPNDYFSQPRPVGLNFWNPFQQPGPLYHVPNENLEAGTSTPLGLGTRSRFQNWNDGSGGFNTRFDLRDADGGITSIDATWRGDLTDLVNDYQPDPATEGDKRLMNGALVTAGSGNRVSVTLEEIPFAAYDVYVFTDVAGTGRQFAWEIRDSAGALLHSGVVEDTTAGGAIFSLPSDFDDASLDGFGTVSVAPALSAGEITVSVTGVNGDAVLNGLALVPHGVIPSTDPIAQATSVNVGGTVDDGGRRTIVLDGSGTTGPVVHQQWAINDHIVATGTNPSLQLPAGDYEVVHRAYHEDGSVVTQQESVSVPANQPPTAVATDVSGVGDPATVLLNGTGSSDFDGTIKGYAWAINGQSLSGPSPSVQLSPGTYNGSLEVTDNAGGVSMDTFTVTVSAQPVIPEPAAIAVIFGFAAWLVWKRARRA